MLDRKKLYTLIAIAKKKLGYNDEAHQLVIESLGGFANDKGKISATTLTDIKLNELYQLYKDKGFHPRQTHKNNDNSNSKKWPINTRTGDWREGLIRKIVAQWNDLANQGKVKDRTLEACRSYCEKQTGTSRLEWFTTYQLNTVIEGLKAWQTR